MIIGRCDVAQVSIAEAKAARFLRFDSIESVDSEQNSARLLHFHRLLWTQKRRRCQL